MKLQKIKDIICNSVTYLFSSMGLIVLVLIFGFVFKNGASMLSFEMIGSNYYAQTYTYTYLEEINENQFEYETKEGEYFSKNWGIALKDSVDLEGKSIVIITYIDANSPLKKVYNISTKLYESVQINQNIKNIILTTKENSVVVAITKDGALKISQKLDQGVKITNFFAKKDGGGIRGSLVSTIYMIFITLLMALPLGIGAAIYLAIYAKKSKFNTMLESLIDVTGGIPSIIFGLVGAIIFIPMFNKVGISDGDSLLAGACTMAIMLLPIIIKNTKEALDNIPKTYLQASLALGASHSQSVFKVILPNAIPGILTAILLSIGRIIGESAALIFTFGASVNDSVAIGQTGTTLATHIWFLMGGDSPNYQLASAISIIILAVVLVLNIVVKIVGKKLNRFEVK